MLSKIIFGHVWDSCNRTILKALLGMDFFIMKRTIMSLVPCLLGVSALGDVDFSRDILPVLSDKCYQCHGPDAKEGRKGDLRLDDESDTKKLRDNEYRVVEPGNPDQSELIRRIFSNDPDDVMPPAELGRNLSAQEKALLKEWVSVGAAWGRHWAFEPIQKPLLNGEKGHPIDQLVQKKHDEEKISMSPRADKRTLIRRLALDLTGLPPAPEIVEAYIEDTLPGAWERAVDRILAEQTYGERMAWDWLEAARYADSNGYQGDGERTMWPWRDWVIQAFNENLPFDQFTIWQLAGDLLPNPTHEQILATGFCRNHMINGEGGRIAEENRVDYVFDMTETMGTVWLGLTLNCSRCHDHKYDPLLQKEYYQLTAFFNQTPVNGGGGSGQTPPVLPSPTVTQKSEMDALNHQINQTDLEIQKRESELSPLQGEWEKKMIAENPQTPWTPIIPESVEAKSQSLEMLENGFVYAGGENPDTDEYSLHYPLPTGPNGNLPTGFQIEAVRHPKMTAGRLSRSDSGNFVLTDIGFFLTPENPDSSTIHKLEIVSAQATFEQGDHKITKTFDNNPTSGWAVWNGNTIDRDHAAVFQIKPSPKPSHPAKLKIILKFNSPHKNHNLGHFRFLVTYDEKPNLNDPESNWVTILGIPEKKRSSEQASTLRTAYLDNDSQLTALKQKKKSFQDNINNINRRVPKVMVMEDRGNSRKTYMLDRGLYNKPGVEVLADLPGALPPLEKPDGRSLNRLDLAKWLVRSDNPLTARVTVNRFWQMFFGIGLVKTAEDFGVQSEYPIHKDLLDWLAADFVESGWDVKNLLKTIVTSETYQQSSAITSREVFERDPENRLLARGPRFRMPSWMIRDQALASGDILNSEIGGPPVFSYQPDGVWAEATFGKKKYRQDSGAKLHRRSLYTFWRRIVGPTMFFDTAKRQVCEVNPLRTNTPMHALTVMNDVTFVEAARALAEKTLNAFSNDENRLSFAFKETLARPPLQKEMEVMTRSLERSLAAFAQNREAAEKFLSHGVTPVNRKLNPELLAAWTAICLNLLNLDETLTKE